jgi:hypothetical protein
MIDKNKYSEKVIKTLLVALLRDAAKIEQNFMCMYLYGAFTMKKRYTDDQTFEHINMAELEQTRRWASTVYLVARQEMEHLALANNLLRSVGGAPCFVHDMDNSAVMDKYFPEPSLPDIDHSCCPECEGLVAQKFNFRLGSFDLAAAKAWTCMEAPDCCELAANDRDHFAAWCFSCNTELKKTTTKKAPSVEELLIQALDSGSTDEIGPGGIATLYAWIERLFELLPPSAFVTSADQQVNITQQYDIYVYPVTDLASAKQAIDLIIKQGEGRQASPTYQSHYRRFYDITVELGVNIGTPDEYERFEPYWPVMENPVSGDVTNPVTKELFDLFDHAYETLLIMLTSLYALPEQNPESYPHFAPALGQEAFAPSMTMIIRSLAELLVQLSANDQGQRVGPGFNVSEEISQLLTHPYCPGTDGNELAVAAGFAGSQLKPQLANIDSMIERFNHFNHRLGDVAAAANLSVISPQLADWAQERVEYIQGNSSRIEVNMRRIYQQGVFSALKSDSY